MKQIEKQTNIESEKSFFTQFSLEQIFEMWHSLNTLLEVAQKLGLHADDSLTRIDYEYIE